MKASVIALSTSFLLMTPASGEVRLKDVAKLGGAAEIHLIGYGLVVGLQGTGDTFRNVPSTEQSLQSMLDRMGLNLRGATLRNRNVAAAIVTGELATTVNPGSRIDVTVSSLGDASSLNGGTLLMTPLGGADGEIYAVAQGAVSITGYEVSGQAETVTQGVPTTGKIPNGGIVQQNIARHGNDGNVLVELTNPDYLTAVRAVNVINQYGLRRFAKSLALESGERTIVVTRPPGISLTRFLADIGELTITADTAARVVVDARSGTVVIGQDVQVSTVAVTHGSLTVRVTEAPVVSQPAAGSRGQTTTAPRTNIDVDQPGGTMSIVGGASLRNLVNGLNKLGLKPSGIIAILQAIKSAGALQAELIVQ